MRTLLLFVGVVAGCTTDETLGEVVQETGSLQGRFLLGSYADELAGPTQHFSVSTTATNPRVGSGTATVVAGHLEITAPGGPYVGVALIGWTLGGTLTITSATNSSDPTVTLYGLYHESARRDYCGGNKATPFRGVWKTNGDHDGSSGSSISFGCADAIAAKCVLWGYVPIYGGPTTPAPPMSANGTAWDYHQACTRMGRADYCATGQPHTRDGTNIDIFDDVPSTLPEPPVKVVPPTAPWPPLAATSYFEAAWRGGTSIGDRTPVCLSRQRWQSIRLDGCPGMLDPRTDTDPVHEPNPKFCDDMKLNEMFSAGALTYNASMFNDLGMHRWTNLSGSELVTTVKGFPGSSWAYSGVTEHDDLDGILIRALPASIQPSQVVEVRSYTGGSDHVVTTATTAPAGYTFDDVEGYIFIDPTEGTSKLDLYSNGSDYVTSTSSPGGGYMPIKTIGYVWN